MLYREHTQNERSYLRASPNSAAFRSSGSPIPLPSRKKSTSRNLFPRQKPSVSSHPQPLT